MPLVSNVLSNVVYNLLDNDLSNITQSGLDIIRQNGGSSLPLGTPVVLDKILSYEESQGLALQGTYVYKTAITGERYGYPDFYEQYVGYYKNSSNVTIKEYVGSNVTNVGSITNNQGVISGFSTSVYATVPNTLPTSTNLEIVAKVKLTGHASEYDVVYHSSVDTPVGFDKNGKLGVWNTSSWQLGSTVYELNRYIWVKTVWNGSSIRVYGMYDNNYNPDNLPNNWTLETTWNTTSNRFSGYTLEFGFNSKSTSQYLRGIIDLNGTFINSNGSRWWTGTTYSHLEYKQNSNGLRFYPISQKSTFDEIYNSTGVADYYGIDEANERIFLPRNNKFWQFTTDTNEVNNYVEAGLPNITGDLGWGDDASSNYSSGCFYANNTNNSFGTGASTDNNNDPIMLDASLSNPIYGKSDTVQPASSKKLLYYVVGNTVSDTSWIDVVTQVEDGVKDLEDKTQEGIERINAIDALKKSQITNCITEIPQDIKLELNNGVLTLKAGSKVYKPNNSFIEVANDISVSYGVAVTGLVAVLTANQGLYFAKPQYVTSGNTEPTISNERRVWHDTTTNIVKMYAPNSSNFEETSLPIAIVSSSGVDNKFASIDQVFNGFGYIGSIAFALPNIKGLIPNGRNADGTLNNIEFTTKRVVTRHITWSCAKGQKVALRLNDTGIDSTSQVAYYYQQEQEPNINTHAYWYKPSVNKLYRRSGTENWYEFNAVVIGEWYNTGENTNISSFNTAQPFRAVDYSEFSTAPHIIESYKNGSSWYRIYSDGWCEQGGNCSASGNVTVTLLKEYSNTDYQVIFSYLGANSTTGNTRDNSIGSQSVGSFTTSDPNRQGTIRWRACGYIA